MRHDLIQSEEVEKVVQLSADFHFASPVYSVEMPKFLSDVNNISQKLLDHKKETNGISEQHPVLMTDNFFDAPEIEEFRNFVGQTSWNILHEQGYAMEGMSTMFSEMWTQEHYKHSLMEQHTHRFGSQIVGFYFLKVPDPAPQAVFYDPRIAAMQGALRERNDKELTLASTAVTYDPKPGQLIFTNSWLAHSFPKNLTDDPFRFVHFNLYAAPNPYFNSSEEGTCNQVEVV